MFYFEVLAMADVTGIMGIVLSLIVIISVGIAFTDEQVTDLTTLSSVTNESFNASTLNNDVSLANADIRGTPTVLGSLNGTGLDSGEGMGIIDAGNYTINLPSGTINVSQSRFANDFYNITYDYAAGTFIEDASTVTLLNLFILFLAIGGLILLGKGLDLF